MLKTVLFDLDSTLLMMDEDRFIEQYFRNLAEWMVPYGYDAEKLRSVIWQGLAAMAQNDGAKTNEEVFWEVFNGHFNSTKEDNYEYYYQYYVSEFVKNKVTTALIQESAPLIEKCKEKGYDLVIATNPFFPQIATLQRVEWAGLNKDDFKLITTYEDFHYCKPNPKYYLEIMEKLNLNPEECVMVGNDVREDGVAETVGIKTFILTDHLLHNNEQRLQELPHGSFDELYEWLELKR